MEGKVCNSTAHYSYERFMCYIDWKVLFHIVYSDCLWQWVCYHWQCYTVNFKRPTGTLVLLTPKKQMISHSVVSYDKQIFKNVQVRPRYTIVAK